MQRVSSRMAQSTPCSDHLTIFGSSHVDKVHAVVAWSTFPCQNFKAPHFRTIFGRADVILRSRGIGLCAWSKASKTWGFRGKFKCVVRHGTFGEDLLKIPLRMTWRPHLSWQGQYFRHVDWKNRAMHWHEAVSSAPNFPFWRKSLRIGSFLMSPTFTTHFCCCQSQKLRQSRRIASFVSLQIDSWTDR